MQWTYARIARKDTGEAHCIFCGRSLRSGRLIVMVDEGGKESFAGPSCAKKFAGSPTTGLIDLFKVVQTLAHRNSAQCAENRANPSETKPRAKNGIKRLSHLTLTPEEYYLRLRADYMLGFIGATSRVLASMANQLSTDGALTKESVSHLKSLMAKAGSESSIYALQNIEHCISAAYWLEVALAATRADKQPFLLAMQKALKEHWKLSENQLTAINKWGKGIRKVAPEFPLLDVKAFSGITTPAFKSFKKDRTDPAGYEK